MTSPLSSEQRFGPAYVPVEYVMLTSRSVEVTRVCVNDEWVPAEEFLPSWIGHWTGCIEDEVAEDIRLTNEDDKRAIASEAIGRGEWA